MAVGVCAHLNHNDYITSTHRGHGHCYAKGAGLVPMFGELLGKANGYCRGKGGSMHIADRETGHLGANAIIGGGIPLATGAALSAKVLRNRGVGVSFFGDGALNEGILLESMNLAAIWNLPAIFACENNHYGEYTPTEQVTAGRLTLRGEAFGIPSAEVDGMDVLAVYDCHGCGGSACKRRWWPSFFVFDTYRYLGHGMSDRTRPYRSREEEDEWPEPAGSHRAIEPATAGGRALHRTGTGYRWRGGPGRGGGSRTIGAGSAVPGPGRGGPTCLRRLKTRQLTFSQAVNEAIRGGDGSRPPGDPVR